MALVRPQFQELLDARAGSAPLPPVTHAFASVLRSILPPEPSIPLRIRYENNDSVAMQTQHDRFQRFVMDGFDREDWECLRFKSL